MLKTTNCHRVIQQASLSALTSMVKESLAAEGYSVELEDLPAFAEIYPGLAVRQGDGHAEFSSYPPPEAPYKASDLAIYIHSSGSTGLPKSIAWTEKIFLLWADSCRLYLTTNGVSYSFMSSKISFECRTSTNFDGRVWLYLHSIVLESLARC